MDDEGDFKKARGFLLTYSALVLALWYFGADLSQFKLMGNEIKLHQRTESVWLVLACLNAYFWLRFVQHVPTGGFRFDNAMNALYDRTLLRAALCVKHFELRRLVKSTLIQKHSPGESAKYVRSYGYLTCYDRIKEDRRNQPEEEIELHHYSREHRTEMKLSANYRYTREGEWVKFGDNVRLDAYVPGRTLSWAVKSSTTVMGAFSIPWFTNHIAPLMFGLISTCLALWKWWGMNYFT
ncbi:hypothetical protein [Pseudomonas reactans]|uniref:hypothetical protein n=1 Tax=Pseudomonas reactans TaxID=117680 RepID=UPI0015A0416D|nr:hypothetical protein [Pseudomonas reactans]NWA65101.1 hypothetical protein [Pseudomonas reactans]